MLGLTGFINVEDTRGDFVEISKTVPDVVGRAFPELAFAYEKSPELPRFAFRVEFFYRDSENTKGIKRDYLVIATDEYEASSKAQRRFQEDYLRENKKRANGLCVSSWVEKIQCSGVVL